MARLSVNINKVALIRNARGSNYPDLLKFARDCEEFGAQGITVHPRPDERHVRFDDLMPLKEQVTTEFNIEGYPSERFMKVVLEVRPDQCTLVPDPPDALTSNTGWDTIVRKDFLKTIVSRLQDQGIRVSLFLDPKPDLVDGAKETGADRIELYTGEYAKGYGHSKEEVIKPFVDTSLRAIDLDIGVNAGHDLNLENLSYFNQQIPSLMEVSIGHALVIDALYYGLSSTIKMYLHRLTNIT